MMTVSDNYYSIIIFFKAKPGKEQILKEFLVSIIEVALQHPGCIKHYLHQSIDDLTAFMFYENWTSKAAHEQHVARSEVQEWRDKLNDFLEKPYEASFWETVVSCVNDLNLSARGNTHGR